MKLVVIGGVAGGTSAAAKAKRINPNLEVEIFERGAEVSFAACGLPYVLSGEIKGFKHLIARTPAQFAQQGIQVKIQHEVTKVDYNNRQLEVLNLLEQSSSWIDFDHLLIATGAKAGKPRLAGIELGNIFTLRNIQDGLAIEQAIEKLAPRAKAVIVGGGYIGLEMAEAFAKRGLQVTVVEQMPRLLGNVDSDIAQIALTEVERHGVTVLLNTHVTSFSGNQHVEKVLTNHGELPADLVLLATGVRPNSALAASFGVMLTPFGAVQVNQHLETNLPGVYAAGDVTEVFHRVSQRHAYIPLGSTANKQGRVAGMNIGGQPAQFDGVVGTAISKVFDLGVALTGLSEIEAAAHGLEAKSVTITSSDHALYYPDQRPLTVRLVYETTGRILGAQIAGHGDATKRIDVIATLLQQNATIDQLATLDLAYAPPFSSVWDPLLIAAQQAQVN